MKTVYVSHPTNFDFEEELYKPLRKIHRVKFIFPHEKSLNPEPSKDMIKKSYMVIAEVSSPSHGVGIELGWADAFNVRIIFIFKKGSKISSSLKILSHDFIEYENVEDILLQLKELIE